jgi:DNA-binding transcriptional LysR family regulator
VRATVSGRSDALKAYQSLHEGHIEQAKAGEIGRSGVCALHHPNGVLKVELAELVDEPWLLPLESIFSSVLAEAFESKGLAVPKMGLRSYSVYQRLSLLATDRFISSLPGSVVRFNIDRFSLKVLPVDFVTRFFQVAVVTLKNRTLSPVVQTFIDCVREAARPLARDNPRP